jgi:O-acetyl-ADP-ribose deacetylase (regulator of RNase III)
MKISIHKADITVIEADAIVNAANKSLLGGGGVDGAIHRKAGRNLLEECKEIRKSYPHGLPVGKVVATKAYNLKAKIIIHTVGPNTENISLLKDCYTNSLKLADDLKCKSIAFPAISTGAFNLPVELSANTVKEVIANLPEYANLEEIKLVLFSDEDYKIYQNILT